MTKGYLRAMVIASMLLLSIIFSVSYAEYPAVAAPAATSLTPAPAATVVAAPEATAAPAPEATTAKAEAPSAPKPEIPLKDKKPVARVVWIKGSVDASQPDSDKRPLKTAANLYLHDTVTTGADSEAQIVFTDNSTLTFRPNTTFYINEYNYEQPAKKSAEKSAGTYVMDLILGGFRTITGYVAKENPDAYTVNTPVATIGVRGTEFSVVYDGKSVYMKRYKGEPCVSGKGSKDKEKEKVCIKQNDKYGYVANVDSDAKVVTTQPDVFQVDVEIVPVTYLDLGNGSGPGTTSGFCIQ